MSFRVCWEVLLSSERRSLAQPICAAIGSPEWGGVPVVCYERWWENLQAFKFVLIGPGRGCGSQVAQTSRLQEGQGEKKGEDGKRNFFLVDSAPSCFMEVALFINSSATLGAIFVGLFCFPLFVRNWWPMSLESWGFDGCSAGRTSLRWLRPQGLNPPATHSQDQVAKSNFKTSPASSPSCSIWFQLHLIP